MRLSAIGSTLYSPNPRFGNGDLEIPQGLQNRLRGGNLFYFRTPGGNDLVEIKAPIPEQAPLNQGAPLNVWEVTIHRRGTDGIFRPVYSAEYDPDTFLPTDAAWKAELSPTNSHDVAGFHAGHVHQQIRRILERHLNDISEADARDLLRVPLATTHH